FALWMSWETAVATAAMALILAAAALVRGTSEPQRVPWTLPAACVWAAGAALAGLWLWSPYGAWPEWYTFVWLPALVGVLVPAPRRWAVLGIATVAGTAAALVTWGAAVEGRLGLAERDVQGLGRAADPRAVSLLERLGRDPPAEAPRTPGELYAWWLASPLAEDDYPASLALWTPAGEPEAEIRLASVDLPPSLMAALVRSPETARGPRVERLDRNYGLHYVLVLPLGGGAEVLTVGVGPRTRLIPAARVARFLQGAASVQPPYQITLSPPVPAPATASARVIWTRTGWSTRGERRLELPDGVHHVHLTVDLRDPWALLVRGVLVVVGDAGALAACWLVSLLLAGGWRPRLPPVMAALRTSYRVRRGAAGGRSAHQPDAARCGGYRGDVGLGPPRRGRAIHCGARRAARRRPVVVPRRGARRHERARAGGARPGRSVSRTGRVCAPGAPGRPRAHRGRPYGRPLDS